jgi:3'-5' exoribonuclease
MSKRQYIADLQHQDKIAEVYLCTRKNLSIDRNGKRFLCLALSDRSGEIEAILWEDAERRADRFSQFDLVEAQGTVMVYQGRMQIHLHDIRRASSAGLVIEEFLHASSMDVEQMWSELCILLGTVENPHLAQLLKYYTSDPVSNGSSN